jgi:Zn-dependent peptidase ImmA (M78 family)
VDYLGASARKPLSERFADAFAASLLMPETGIRRQFLSITRSTGDFRTADLSRLAGHYCVSFQAMAHRLEGLGLLPRGTWDLLQEKGFQPTAARRLLGLESPCAEKDTPWPER